MKEHVSQEEHQALLAAVKKVKAEYEQLSHNYNQLLQLLDARQRERLVRKNPPDQLTLPFEEKAPEKP
jgi:hypothetical protein